MSTRPPQLFTFDGYTVRPITPQDETYLMELIEGDAFHRNKLTPDFFLKLKPGEDAWALEDETGQVVFYFKTSTAVRMAIQFAASDTPEERRRNQTALIKGLRWIEGIFRANHFREIIFDTEGLDLELFARRRLGFESAPMLLSKTLSGELAAGASATPERFGSEERAVKISPEPVGTLPTSTGESGGDANVRP